MTKRLRTFKHDPSRTGFVFSAFWHELIVLTSGYHRGICLMRYKGRHSNRWGTVPVFSVKF